MFSVGVSKRFKSRQLGKQISMCYHRVMGLAEQIGISWLFWYPKSSFVCFCVFWQLWEVLHLMIHQILRILLCKSFHCFQCVLLPLLYSHGSEQRMPLWRGCGLCWAHIEGWARLLQGGWAACHLETHSPRLSPISLSCQGGGSVLWDTMSPWLGTGSVQSRATGTALLQVLPGYSCAQVGSGSVPALPSRGRGAFLTTRRWEGPWSKPECAVRRQYGYTLRAMGHIYLKSRTWTPSIKRKPRKPNTQSFQVAAEVRLTFFHQPMSRVRQMWVSLKYCLFSGSQQTPTLKFCHIILVMKSPDSETSLNQLRFLCVLSLPNCLESWKPQPLLTDNKYSTSKKKKRTEKKEKNGCWGGLEHVPTFSAGFFLSWGNQSNA